REWLMANNFMGKEGQQVPAMSDEWIQTISNRYIELYEKVTGSSFVPVDLTDDQLENCIRQELLKMEIQ
ncbi:MAG: phosphoribosylaminoimidazolesuccinocarboxamide synthase, partial [Sediminibacterium sp.]